MQRFARNCSTLVSNPFYHLNQSFNNKSHWYKFRQLVEDHYHSKQCCQTVSSGHIDEQHFLNKLWPVEVRPTVTLNVIDNSHKQTHLDEFESIQVGCHPHIRQTTNNRSKCLTDTHVQKSVVAHSPMLTGAWITIDSSRYSFVTRK